LIGFLRALKCHCVSDAALQIGTTSTAKVENNAAAVCIVNGQFVTLAADTETAFTATTDDITASANEVREAVYLLLVDSAGASRLLKGDEESGAGNAVAPHAPEDEAVVGAIRIAVAAGSTNFDATTDALSEAHITDTYYDLAFSPTDVGETL